jgi:hypothetical protein
MLLLIEGMGFPPIEGMLMLCIPPMLGIPCIPCMPMLGMLLLIDGMGFPICVYMCMRMYMYMCVCVWHSLHSLHAHVRHAAAHQWHGVSSHLCFYMCVYVYVCVDFRLCIHACTFDPDRYLRMIYVYMYVHIRLCVCVCWFPSVHSCVYV